jgi:phage terminase Nu1 subunit (DNA packaging protein)
MEARVFRISPRSEPWMDKKQLAQHLGFSVRWVELRVREGMPCERWGKGRRLRFRSSEVEDWLRGRAA